MSTITKLSVSIDQHLVNFLEHYQQQHQLKSKSEVISQALRLLQAKDLESQYAAAMLEWRTEAADWESVAADV